MYISTIINILTNWIKKQHYTVRHYSISCRIFRSETYQNLVIENLPTFHEEKFFKGFFTIFFVTAIETKRIATYWIRTIAAHLMDFAIVLLSARRTRTF